MAQKASFGLVTDLALEMMREEYDGEEHYD